MKKLVSLLFVLWFNGFTARRVVKNNTIIVSHVQLQNFVLELWDADVNRVKDDQIEINVQNKTTTKNKEDLSSDKLFHCVNPLIVTQPTFARLIDLFDSYEANSGKLDADSDDRSRKVNIFLDEVFGTLVMIKLREMLNSLNYSEASSEERFRHFVKQLWFGDYSRNRQVVGSSGFEHVFIGEIKKGKAVGLHNWIRLYWLENHDELFYTGYFNRRDHIMTIQFKWGKYWKPIGSMFIGTSPEFELALYTLCFLTKQGQDTCPFMLDNCSTIRVTTMAKVFNGETYIGTAYPSLGKVVKNCTSVKRMNSIR